MFNNFAEMIEVTQTTESGIQIAKPKLIIPKSVFNVNPTKIIVPATHEDLKEAISSFYVLLMIIECSIVV